MRNRQRRDARQGSLTNWSVAALLLGRTGKVFGEYQVANTPRERQTVKGDNYLVFNICDVDPLDFKNEPTICMKIWQSDNLADDLVDGLHEENAKIRLTGVKCTQYQNTPQLTLNGDFSDGKIQLVNTASAPSRSMPGNRPYFEINSRSKMQYDHQQRGSFEPHSKLPSFNTNINPAAQSGFLTPKSASKRARESGVLYSDVNSRRSLASRPLKRRNVLTKQFTFERGRKMGITLKPERFVQPTSAENRWGARGIGARVVKFNRDSSIVGMVIHEINGDKSIRKNSLKEIQALLTALSKRCSVTVVFGPSENLETNSSKSGLPLESERLQPSSMCTPTFPKTCRPNPTPPVSPFVASKPHCKTCAELNKQVKDLKKRVELLEGKCPVRKLTKDELEDLLENAESLTTRVRRELSKRAKEPNAECNICMDAKPNQTFVPCGHCVCCEKCASTLRVCPLCRVKITQKVRSFFA